jgi:hypothetical protein
MDITIDWTEYIGLAERLLLDVDKLTDGQKQANFRGVSNHAYYGAYNLAKIYLIDYEMYYPSKLEKENDHIYVRDSFVDSRNAVSRQIGLELRELRFHRNSCDYMTTIKLSLEELHKQAKNDLVKARRVEALLARLRSQKK